jgi:hypothetical protein
MFTQGPSLVIDVETGEIHKLNADGSTTLFSSGGGGNGLSAYQIAVNNGFVGTEAEWLASLVGADGIDGAAGINGANGLNGADGAQGIQGIQGPPGEPPSLVKLTADLAASTSTTVTNTVGLSFALTAGVYYEFRFLVVFRSAATTTGIRLGMTAPAFNVFSAKVKIPIAADGAGGELQGWLTTSGDTVFGTGVQAINTDYLAEIIGVILPSANGTLQVTHATEVAASGVTVRQGSLGLLRSY